MGIRCAAPDDAEVIKRLALDNGMFRDDEMDDFGEMLAGFFDGTMVDHSWVVRENEHGEILGAVYYAPEPFSDRMWNVYFIAVAPGLGRGGIGGELMMYVESTLRDRGEEVARTLIVETSSLPEYERSRSFYAKQGYDEEARIRQFYGPGDDKVVFWKKISGTP